MPTRPEQHPPVHARRRMGPRQIVVLVIVALTVLFVVQNRDPVQIRFFTLTVNAALWFVLIIMVGLGAAIGGLVARRK